jgi:type IV secretion system protein VirB11
MVADFFAGPLRRFLDREDVTEVLMNQPGEVWTESRSGWQRHEVPELDMLHCTHMAEAVAAYRNATLSHKHPLLSAGLPGGERAQFCIYPAVPEETFSLTIRRPAALIPTAEHIEPLFRRTKPAGSGELQQQDRELLRLKDAGDFLGFLRLAVALRKTIVVSGQTGAGKTFILKYLCSLIDRRERLITIESVRELMLLHANAVNLLYTDDEQGLAQITPRQLLKAALRMRPDRILLAEVRDEECYFFVRAAASGHPGSMTTLHAGTCEEAFAQMVLMIRQSAGGSGLTFPEIDRLLRMTVDVVVQFGNDPASGRFVSEVYFDPARRMRAAQGAVL